MQWYWVALILFGSALGLMMLGIPVAVGFFITNVIAAVLFMGGGPGIQQIINNGFGAMTNFALVPLPMFLLMGELFYHTGLAARCFNAADKLLGNIRGRLAYVTLIGGTAYAGPAGSSMGACALLGRLMVPEMMKRGYSKYLSLGPIMGVGGLAVIIPPSALTVLLATLGQTDVGALLIAGVIPGLLLATMYGVLIWGWTVVDPKSAPMHAAPQVSAREKLRLFFVDVVPMIVIIVFSVLIMITGWSTPTEAAALAALYALLVSAFVYRSVGWKDVYRSLVTSSRVTVSLGMLIAGALVFNFVITSENIPKTLSAYLATHELSPLAYLFFVNILLIVLGCFLEGTTIILVILPVLLGPAQSLGIDPVHFGVVCIVNIMLGLVTPPYGLLLFMMNKIADVPLGAIVREVMPFLYVMIAALALITLVPDFVLWLPRLLGYKG